MLARHTEGQLIGNDWATNGSFDDASIIIADRELGIALQVLRGTLGDQVDRTGRRAASIERALWATQNLDPLDIIKAG